MIVTVVMTLTGFHVHAIRGQERIVIVMPATDSFDQIHRRWHFAMVCSDRVLKLIHEILHAAGVLLLRRFEAFQLLAFPEGRADLRCGSAVVAVVDLRRA
ncbi:hypothetical protein MF410_30520 (plasmid) [Rhizobium sp. C104]|uniref:hypothetical protein n=1 Tax=Rhizobium sp. C104 TaxID=2917727 RepID=UPI001EF8DAEA|nr:hypothetical protein [Rhizobium sp. C104]ULJ81770.1 hypothetical protein MF410_30520 [Rhizobium sp. C104]